MAYFNGVEYRSHCGETFNPVLLGLNLASASYLKCPGEVLLGCCASVSPDVKMEMVGS